MTDDEKDECIAKRMYIFSRGDPKFHRLEEPETWEALQRQFPEWVTYWKAKAREARLEMESFNER